MADNQRPALPKEKETGINISDIWTMIWSHKWWYAACIAVSLIFAAVYLYRYPEIFVRTVKIMVDESEQDAALRNLGVVSAASAGLHSYNNVENEIVAFSSPDLMQIVVERLDLQTRYIERQFLRDVELYGNLPFEMCTAGDNPQTGFSFTVSADDDGNAVLTDFKVGGRKVREKVIGNFGDTLTTPVGAIVLYSHGNSVSNLRNEISVSWAGSMSVAKDYVRKLAIGLSGKQSSVIVISMEDTFPDRASAVLTSLVDVYNEVWIANKNRSAINTAEFINERLIIIEKDLSAVEQSLKKYKADNNLTDMKAAAQSYIDESTYYATKSFEVTNQLSIAGYIKEYLNNPAKKDDLIPSNLGLANTSVEMQIKEYNEIVLQRDRLRSGSGKNNPLIAEMNSSLSAIRTAILGSVNNLIASLELQKEKLESQERQILSRMSSSSGQELQLLSLQRQQNITQDLYVFLLERREENELASLVNVGNTRMIMRPNGPSGPVAPDKMLVLLVALTIGTLLPFAVFFVLKITDTAIKTRSDLDGLTVPFLGEIPLDRSMVGTAKNSGRIIVSHGKRDMMNEAFRVLRTNIDMMLGKEKVSNVIMLTSFTPDAGKTFTIMNIGAGMALKGAKVLMLDLDLRRASLSRSLGAYHDGVVSYLNGKKQDYHDDIMEIDGNLYLLPVGKLPPNPTELLLSSAFTDMVVQMRNEYDYIFIDCPPVDIVADASIITAVTDLTVFVLRAEMLDKKVLPLVQSLYDSGQYGRMAIMLNGVDMKYKRYGYGNKGRLGYGYGYGD